MTNRELLLTGNPKTTSLMLMLIDLYGTDALQWDIETIKLELEDDLRVKLSEDSLSKLAVGCQLLTTNKFYVSAPDFIHFCNVINDEKGMSNVWSPADAYEIAWAMVEVGLLDPPEDAWEKTLSPEIMAYIIIVLREAGLNTPPDSLKFISSDQLLGPDIGKFSDDQMLFEAAYAEAKDASDAINTYVNAQTYDLLQELSGLQLKNGSVKEVTEKLLKTVSPPPILQN